MTKIVPLFKDALQPPPKFGHTLLEAMQERQGMPYHAPTVQVREIYPGADLWKPANPLADLFREFSGRQVFSPAQLDAIKRMGMVVERVGG
jgi:hypothetical protein